MYPNVSKCNANRCVCCTHLCTKTTIISSVNGKQFSIINNNDMDWTSSDLIYVITWTEIILGQVWYLIASIPDLCTLTYFYDALPFSTVWKKLLHPFKSYWSEITNWQFSQSLSKKGHYLVKILRVNPLSELNLYLMMLDPSVKSKLNWCMSSKLSTGNPKCDATDNAAAGVMISMNRLYFNFLASLCSWAGWFESHFVGNPEDRFSRVTAQISQCPAKGTMWHMQSLKTQISLRII